MRGMSCRQVPTGSWAAHLPSVPEGQVPTISEPLSCTCLMSLLSRGAYCVERPQEVYHIAHQLPRKRLPLQSRPLLRWWYGSLSDMCAVPTRTLSAEDRTEGLRRMQPRPRCVYRPHSMQGGDNNHTIAERAVSSRPLRSTATNAL